ncbi:MAG TPA: zf-HC2 domain-containing protein [Gemmatimonadaceae bacterium]|nr:zf-HC2 domain-containing protein [Gemmatimonadaceae bacterium]
MQHPDEGTIHAWLDGALSPEEAARVDAHVKECAQCQAAVAEARGFIAASSRILTALDNVPSGVVPATAAPRRVQPWVWRVAATVVVVAGATLVLVERKDEATFQEKAAARVQAVDKQASTLPAADSVAVSQPTASQPAVSQPTASLGAANATAATSAFTPQVAPSEPRLTGKRVSPPSAQSMNSAATAKRVDEASGAVARERSAASDQRRIGAVEQNRLEANLQTAAPGVVSPRPPSVALDVAETSPRAVATKRMLGKTQTFYELAPGDTVVLEEQFTVQLEEIVVTGAATKRPQALSGRAAGQAAAAPETQQKAEVSPAPPPPVALQDAQNPEIHRISWLDRSSGRVLVLSGRHSQEELQQIRDRIQQLRDAAQPKKNPE